MRPDWNNLQMEPGAVQFLRAEYELAETTLKQKIENGDEDGAALMRRLLRRIEKQAVTRSVGDQPDELPLD